MKEVDKSTKDALMAAGMAIMFTIFWTSTAERWTLDWWVYNILAWIGSMNGLWYFTKQVFTVDTSETEIEK